MKHRNHMLVCGIAVLAAVMLLTRGGASPLGAGIGLALLLCPLVMGTVMWLLMRQPARPISPIEHKEVHEADVHSGARGRP